MGFFNRLREQLAYPRNTKVTEIYVGGTKKKEFSTSPDVTYRYDQSRKSNGDDLYELWKINPIYKSRVAQLNALVFGKGIQYVYQDDKTKEIIDRLWRVNRIRSKLNQYGTDTQIYGELFLGLYPQQTGDVLITAYGAKQIDIDFDPSDPNKVKEFRLSYKDEETQKEKTVFFKPLEQFLLEMEMATPIGSKAKGFKGSLAKAPNCMVHLKFNCTSEDVYGTSDLYSTSDLVRDYMRFVGDRLTIHSMYGAPIYDITIDTDDEDIINKRVEELQYFEIGSNPVHNASETWKLLNSGGGQGSGTIKPEEDNKMLRALIASGLQCPVPMLFQCTDESIDSDKGAFAFINLALDRQEAFREMFEDIHKFSVFVAGGDYKTVDDGQLIFPDLDLSSTKSRAETFALLVNTSLISRQTASEALGYIWERESERMLAECDELKDVIDPELNAEVAGGSAGGEGQTSKDPNGSNNTKTRDKNQRSDVNHVSSTSSSDKASGKGGTRVN